MIMTVIKCQELNSLSCSLLRKGQTTQVSNCLIIFFQNGLNEKLLASIPVARRLNAVSSKSQSNACKELLIWRLLLSKWPDKSEV